MIRVGTVTGDSEAEVRARMREQERKGWKAVGNPGPLLVGGRPESGRAAWCWQMVRRTC